MKEKEIHNHLATKKWSLSIGSNDSTSWHLSDLTTSFDFYSFKVIPSSSFIKPINVIFDDHINVHMTFGQFTHFIAQYLSFLSNNPGDSDFGKDGFFMYEKKLARGFSFALKLKKEEEEQQILE